MTGVFEPACGYVTVRIVLTSTLYCVATLSYFHNTKTN